MKSFIHFLNEDAVNDSNIRAEANSIYDSIIKEISNDKYLLGEMDGSGGEDDFLLMDEPVDKPDLNVYITLEDKNNKGEMHPVNEKGIYKMILFIVNINLSIEENFNAIVNYKDTFVHEYVHYIDMKRYQWDDLKQYDHEREDKEIKAPDRKDFHNNLSYSVALITYEEFLDKSYYGDDLEQNAFYQQFTHMMDQFIELQNNNVKNKLISDFDFFLKYTSKFINKNYANFMSKNEKTYKKLMKRIYGNWYKLQQNHKNIK